LCWLVKLFSNVVCDAYLSMRYYHKEYWSNWSCTKHGNQMDAEGFGNCTNTEPVKWNVLKEFLWKYRPYEQRISLSHERIIYFDLNIKRIH
jgi:hypothetical protein